MPIPSASTEVPSPLRNHAKAPPTRRQPRNAPDWMALSVARRCRLATTSKPTTGCECRILSVATKSRPNCWPLGGRWLMPRCSPPVIARLPWRRRLSVLAWVAFQYGAGGWKLSTRMEAVRHAGGYIAPRGKPWHDWGPVATCAARKHARAFPPFLGAVLQAGAFGWADSSAHPTTTQPLSICSRATTVGGIPSRR